MRYTKYNYLLLNHWSLSGSVQSSAKWVLCYKLVAVTSSHYRGVKATLYGCDSGSDVNVEGRVIGDVWNIISGCPLICLWLRTAMRSTWTGIGTTRRGLATSPPTTLGRPSTALWFSTTPALTRFHLARRFWNQILTWTSLRRSWRAITERSDSDRYFLPANSRSSSTSWSLLNAVRRRRRRRRRSSAEILLPDWTPDVVGSPPSTSSSE